MPSRKPAKRSEPLSALHYTGDASGVPHISGIPSRDLSADDVRRLAHRLGLQPAALAALLTRGPFTAARPLPAANSSADDSEKGDN